MRTATSLARSGRVADGLAWAALALTAVAAVAGLAVADLYRDNAAMVRQAQASDLATLLVAVPVLAVGLWFARAGSAAGRLVALGALGFVAYTYAIFAFSVVIGPATPLHIAIVGLATWSLVLMASSIEADDPDPALAARLPRRTTGAFLLVVAALFALTWLGLIAGAITSGRLPPAVAGLGLPTNPVYTLDLAFALPLLAVGGVRLLRGDERGPATALALLVLRPHGGRCSGDVPRRGPCRRGCGRPDRARLRRGRPRRDGPPRHGAGPYAPRPPRGAGRPVTPCVVR